MKTLLLCLLFLCTGASARAQSPAAAEPPQGMPGVEVVKFNWSKERLNWEGDPFGGTIENFDDVRRRMADQRRMERARGTGNLGEALKVEREQRAEQIIKHRPPPPPRYAFLYKLSIKNSGPKTIKEIDWDYIFSDAATGQELDRRQFTGVEKISPGKSKELSFLVTTPPTRTISVQSLNKKEREGLNERVVIVRVLYDDGTVWQQP